MKRVLGARIRERRRSLKMSQAELARRMGISASYLNLIEHNKRAIAGARLYQAAKALDLRPDELDGAEERRLFSDLEQLVHSPDLIALGVEAQLIGELIGQYPGWTRALVALARSESEAMDTVRNLTDRLTHDVYLNETVHRILTGIAAIRSASEILGDYADIDETTQEQFHQIIHKESHQLTQVGEALANYLDKSDTSERVLTPLDEVEALFEVRENRFEEIETGVDQLGGIFGPNKAPRFADARVVAESDFVDCINAIIENEPQIETELAQFRAREALLDYTARALLLPMHRFAPKVNEHGFDIEALASLYSTDIETVCHRLTALPPDAGVPRFGYFLANASGAIIATRGMPNLVSPRYASACPLWVLYRAQQSPETIIRQRALFPSGARFVFLARSRLVGPVGFGQPRHYLTDMIAVSEQDAVHTIYAPDSTVPVELLGSTCRGCPRTECGHRVADPLAG